MFSCPWSKKASKLWDIFLRIPQKDKSTSINRHVQRRGAWSYRKMGNSSPLLVSQKVVLGLLSYLTHSSQFLWNTGQSSLGSLWGDLRYPSISSLAASARASSSVHRAPRLCFQGHLDEVIHDSYSKLYLCCFRAQGIVGSVIPVCWGNQQHSGLGIFQPEFYKWPGQWQRMHSGQRDAESATNWTGLTRPRS